MEIFKKDDRNRILGRIIPWIALVALGFGVIQQSTFLLNRRVVPAIKFIGEFGENPAYFRGAYRLEGEEFASYIRFLRAEIPLEASVMLPPRIPVRPIAHVGLMQYFLFPREIHNCGVNEVDECLERIREDPDFFVLGLKDFPPSNHLYQDRSYVPFNEEIGLFVPNQ